MTQNSTQLNKSRKAPVKRRSLLILALIIILALGLATWYYLKSIKNTTSSNDSQTSSTPINVPTESANTEGKTIQVPTNVDPSSIKNYELVTENEDFKIRKLDNQYVITLYPIINHPDADSYTSQLKQFKQEALNYLSKSGLDTNTLSITYEPAEAAQL